MNNNVSNKSPLANLLSPAVGLAVLGTCAFIFSFYRAGQLADLVLPKDSPRPKKSETVQPNIDVNSQALLIAIDSSVPARLASGGNYKQAIAEALKNLTDNSPTDIANIALAGDILSAVGNKEDKDIGFALLSKAMTMVPTNQYLACRYAQRMAANGQLEKSAQKLVEIAKNNPDLKSIHLVLAKVYVKQNKPKAAMEELNKIKDGSQLTAKEQEEAGLLFVKLGDSYGGYKLFKLAISGKPENRFYANYCIDTVGSSTEDYKTALAIVEANLSNNPSADQLTLRVRQSVLLLLLGRSKEAKSVLEQALTKHKDNFDLQVLLAAANFSLGNSDQALSNLEASTKTYQPRL